MDRTCERETRDLMSVESFSQLPFIRRPVSRENTGGGVGAIRLFGKEFANSKTNTNDHQSDVEVNKDSSNGTETSSRKFDCHYCCRNFPTSQALGGHQNAHKSERQQAKRAHLQSTMLHASFADPRVYGLINHGSLASSPRMPMAYHSWTGGGGGNAYSAASSRIYGGYASFTTRSQPINGSPLAYWRVPATQNSSVFAATSNCDRPVPRLTSSASQFRFGHEAKTEMHEHRSVCASFSSLGIDHVEGRKMNGATREPLFTHSTRKFTGTIDYIFYGGDELRVEALLELLSEESLQEYTGILSPAYPSDHIPLLAQFGFKQR